MMVRKIMLIVIVGSYISSLQAQIAYDLEDILKIARNDTWLSKDANNQMEIASQEFKLFQSQLRPSLSVDGRIPGYFQSSSDIIQPNGTIEFQRISQNNASVSLFALQEISATGGQVFVQSDLRRFDDFSFDNRLYNGVPIRIGLIQPLFGFRALKWQKQIAPQQLIESKKQFTADIENTQLQAVALYFEIIVASESNKIAQLNTEVNERLLNIAKERLELGKISEDEKIQLEIELENAKVNLRQSDYALQSAEKILWTFLGQKTMGSVSSYKLPLLTGKIEVDEEVAIEMARNNRPEIIAFQKRLLIASESVAKAKANTGPQMNLFASFGLARGSAILSEVYSEPFTEQQLSLTFSVPIVDWGKRKSTVKMAEISKDNEIEKIKQEQSEFENFIRLKVQEFQMLQLSIQDQEGIKNLAEKRFNIANERYVLGAISITDWTLAQREKDQTQRNYVQTLSNYWTSYYTLRLLTGYDFQFNQKINY